MIQTTTQPRPQPSMWQQRQITALACLFIVLGFGLLAALLQSIATNPHLRIGELEALPVVWRFLQHFGVIRPVLIIGAALLSIRLGWRLNARAIGAARWAQTSLIWLLLLSGVGTLQAFFAGVQVQQIAAYTLPWVILAALTAISYITLKRVLPYFEGEEAITDQYTRRAWNLLMPTVIIFLVIALSPLEQVFIASLTDERFASSDVSQFVGLENYAQLLSIRIDKLPCEINDDGACKTELRDGVEQVIYPNPRGVLGDEYRALRYRELTSFNVNNEQYVISARDREFIDAAWTSLIYTIAAIGLQLALGLFIAIILASRLRGMSYLHLAILIPLAIPTLIATQFWDVMFTEDASGVINSVLMSLGIIDAPKAWLLDRDLQIPAVVLVIVWKETPGMALLLLPGLLNISKEIYEAAEVDGLNRIQRFFKITLPLLRPTIGVALVLRTMVTLRVFDVFDILLGRVRFSMSTYAYETLTLRQQLGYSSAISVTIFIIILIFTVIYVRTLRIDDV